MSAAPTQPVPTAAGASARAFDSVAEKVADKERFLKVVDRLRRRLDAEDERAKAYARKVDRLLEEHKLALAKATGMDIASFSSVAISSVSKRLQKISEALTSTKGSEAVALLKPLLNHLEELARRSRSTSSQGKPTISPQRLSGGSTGPRSIPTFASPSSSPPTTHGGSANSPRYGDGMHTLSSDALISKPQSADLPSSLETIRVFLADGSSKNFVTDTRESALELLQRIIGKLTTLNKDFIRGVSLWEVPFNTGKGAVERQILPSENLAYLKRTWRRPSRFYLFTKFEQEMRSGTSPLQQRQRAGSGPTSPRLSPRALSPLPSPRVIGTNDTAVKLLLEDDTFKSFIVTPTETWASFKKRALSKLQQQLDIDPSTVGIFIYDGDDQEQDFDEAECVASSLTKLSAPRLMLRTLSSTESAGDLSARAQKKNEKAVSIITHALKSSKTKKLSLANLQLKDLPVEIKLIAPTATHLDLSGNAIQVLSDTLTTVQHLKSLNASNNRISVIPSFISSFSHIRVLDFSTNRLTSVPPEIGVLHSLSSLCLSHNKIDSLPSQMGNLVLLEELTISHNLLSDLPESFSTLTNLKMLDISSNAFLTLPDVMSDFSSLEELYAASNQLRTLPNWICSLTALRCLDFSSNVLGSVPDDISRLVSLEEFLLLGNPLESGIPVDRMKLLKHLSRLQLPDESLAEYVLTHLDDNTRGGELGGSQPEVMRSQKSVADLIGGGIGSGIAGIIPTAGPHFDNRRSNNNKRPGFIAMSLSDDELLVPGAINKPRHGTFGSDEDSFSGDTHPNSLLSGASGASDSSNGILHGSFPGSPSDSEFPDLNDDSDDPVGKSSSLDRPFSLDRPSSIDRERPSLLDRPYEERSYGRQRSNSRDGITSPNRRFVRNSSSKVSLVAQAALSTQMAAAIEKERQKLSGQSESSSESESITTIPHTRLPGSIDESSESAGTNTPTSSASSPESAPHVVAVGLSIPPVSFEPPRSRSLGLATSLGDEIAPSAPKRKSFAAKRPLSEAMIQSDTMKSKFAMMAAEPMPPSGPVSVMEHASPALGGLSSPPSHSFSPTLLIAPQVLSTNYHVESGRDLSGQLPPGKDAIFSALNLKLMEFYQDDYFTHFHQFPHVNILAIDPAVGPVVGSILLVKEQRRRSDVFRALVRTTTGDVTMFIPADGPAWDSGSRKKSKTYTEQHALKMLKKQLVGQIDLSNARIVRTPEFASDLLLLDSKIQASAFKFGVLYCAPGQTTENEFYNNDNPSPAFEEFTEFLAEKIRLKGWRRYSGGLDVDADRTGKYALYRRWATTEIVFHVSTLIPYKPDDEQQIDRKKHIGNDVVVVVFQDEGSEPFDPRNVRSVFNHVFIVVRALPLQSPGSSRYYQIAVVSKSGVKEHTPLLPRPAIFEKGPNLLRFLLTKMINSERASYSAIGFAPAIARTRLMLLQELTQKHIQAQRLKKRN